MISLELLTSDETVKDMCLNAALAALTCRGNEHMLDDSPDAEPEKLLARLVKMGHESVIEHINLTFRVEGMSRALLQELARHRHLSLSVQSTRYSMSKMIDGLDADTISGILRTALTPLSREGHSAESLDSIADEAGAFAEKCLKDFNTDNDGHTRLVWQDFLKYLLPEFIPCNLVMTCNLRELRHLFKLRLSKHALYEFRLLMVCIFDALPPALYGLVEDVIDADELNRIEEEMDFFEEVCSDDEQ